MFATTPECQTAPEPKRSAPRAAEPIIAIRPSRYLRYFYLTLYSSLALLALSLTALGGHFALLAVGLSALLVLQLGLRLRGLSEQHWRLQYDADCWWLARAGSELKPARLVGDVRLWRAVTFLRFIDQRGAQSLVLCADSVAPADLRRLRTWLVTHQSAC